MKPGPIVLCVLAGFACAHTPAQQASTLTGAARPVPAALKPPLILKTAAAEFGSCRATGSRQTVVGVVVSPAGLPTAETVARSSGDTCLDGKALQAVHGYSFRAASLQGKPVSAAIRITVNFMQVGAVVGRP